MILARPLTLVVAGLAACGGTRSETPESSAAAATGRAAAPIPLADSPNNACGWLPVAAVEGAIGPFAGEPRVVRSIEKPAQADSLGTACRYDLADGNAVTLQVDLTGSLAQERVGGTMLRGFRNVVETMAGTESAGSSDAPSPGWDHTGKLFGGFSTFTGRVGHIAISTAALKPGIEPARTLALAERVRDAIPDLPFALPLDPMLAALAAQAGETIQNTPSGPDPCGLISVSEAEAVLGKLVVPPFRSTQGAPLADPAGSSCAYYTRGHRAFMVQPHWDSGPRLFRMASALGGVAAGAIGLDGAAADTLEGAWEQAASSGVTGTLYFLKGERMLEVNFVTASTDMAGAVRLAAIAMRKM